MDPDHGLMYGPGPKSLYSNLDTSQQVFGGPRHLIPAWELIAGATRIKNMSAPAPRFKFKLLVLARRPQMKINFTFDAIFCRMLFTLSVAPSVWQAPTLHVDHFQITRTGKI